MKNVIYPVIVGLLVGFGFTACGGDDDDGDEEAVHQLEHEKQKYDGQQIKINRIKELQAKVKDETITAAEQKELDSLYYWLESNG